MANAQRYCMIDETHEGDNVFVVARPSIFGNPYTHLKGKKTLAQIKVRSRLKAVELYGKYFDKMLEKDEDFRNAFDRMYEAFKKYEVIYIGCYCHVDDGEPCHADEIIKRLNQRLVKEKLKELKNHAKKEET